MMKIPGLHIIKEKAASAFRSVDNVMRDQAVSTIEYEADELDHIFTLLVLGMFVGIPSPPIHILSLIHISEPTRQVLVSRMPSSA